MTSSSTTTTTTTELDATSGDLTQHRAALEVLDLKIIDLIRTRREMSKFIQDLKIRQGLPRVDLTQEAEVIKLYDNALGPQGSIIASHLLVLSKG